MLASLLRPRCLPVLLLLLFSLLILILRRAYWHLPLLQAILPLLPSLPLSTLPPASRADILKESLPNLPEAYLYSNEVQKMVNSSCAKFPNLLDIQFGNIYWQVTETSNGVFHLYSAHLDTRTQPGPTVRILAMLNRIKPTVKTFCQLWYKNETAPVITEVTFYNYIWEISWGNYKQGLLQPYLLACLVPKSHWARVPEAVSLVERPCDNATSALRVHYDLPEPGDRQEFGVCVKGLSHTEDLSVKLVEWIELLGLLGASRIFLYTYGTLHPRVEKTLKYYHSTDQVKVIPITLPGHQPNFPTFQHSFIRDGKKLVHKRQSELIPYNDCFYRNMYRYRRIAVLDIDEVIVPLNHSTWGDMMADLEEDKDVAGWTFRNVYFMDEMKHLGPPSRYSDVPAHLHMLQHVSRSAKHSPPGDYIKSFFSTEKTLLVFNHFPFRCLGDCKIKHVNISRGQLQHYKPGCSTGIPKSACDSTYRNHTVEDTTVWRWKKELVARAGKVIQQLDLLQ